MLPIAHAAHATEHKAIGDAAAKKVFRTLRTLRVVKRYKGRRDLKAKKEAEAKKDAQAE